MLKRLCIVLCCFVALSLTGCKLVQVVKYIGPDAVRGLVDTSVPYLMHVMEDELAGAVEDGDDP